MTPEERREATIRRILVAVDSSAPARPPIEAAVELASRLQATLEALFLEDRNLMRLAELPFARRIPAYGRPTDVDPVAVEREWRAAREEARRALEEASRRRRIHSAFRVMREGRARALEEVFEVSDALVLGWGSAAAPTTGPRRPAPPSRGPLLVAVAPDASADRALAVAPELLAGARRPLWLVVVGGGGLPADLADRAGRLLPAGVAPAAVRAVADLGGLARLAREASAGGIVLSARHPAARLLTAGVAERRMPCPVILVP